ncbi:MAG: dienelactone hydrolase family protein [Rhodobacteraceae bacterium]|nr:dienelactone hydrolase family protein [Paracoccaceae bacterium]
MHRLTLALILALVATPSLGDGLGNATKRFTDPALMQPSDWTDAAEMVRTWQSARVRVPDGKGGARAMSAQDLSQWHPPGGTRYPLAIYLHGCSGFWAGTDRRLNLLASLGFVAIAPASFARMKYPQSCDTIRHRGGLYRHTLAMRQADAGHALDRGRILPSVDRSRVLLIGLSQGAITAATYAARPGQHITARVIEGWTCHSGWPDHRGVNAGSREAVLALVGAADPWFRHPDVQGDCSAYLKPGANRQSIVYRNGQLARTHELLDHAQPRQALTAFLAAVFAR